MKPTLIRAVCGWVAAPLLALAAAWSCVADAPGDAPTAWRPTALLALALRMDATYGSIHRRAPSSSTR
jgi:hypothetical protein